MIGTGMPFQITLTADAPARVQHDQRAGGDSVAGDSLTGQLRDIVDLSENLETDLRNRRGPSSYAPRQDAADTPANIDDIRDELAVIGDKLDSLSDTALHAQAVDRRERLGRGLEETGVALERIGRKLSAIASAGGFTAETVDAPRQFVSLVKGFREVVKEVEMILADEDRVPPPLMRLIRNLTSESLKPESRRRVDEMA